VRAVNLLPREPDAKSVRNEDPAVVIGSVLGVIVMIALVAGFLTAHSKVGAEQKKLTAARIEMGKLSLRKLPPAPKKPKVTRPIIPVPAVTSEEAPLLQAIGGAMSTRIAWDRLLREFSLVVPSDVTISALTLSAPQSPVAATTSASGEGFSITGLAYSHDSVARLLSRLQLIPDLSDVTLSSSTAATTNASAQVTFIISATVKGGPVPVVPTVPTPTDTTDTSTDGST
jgi:Tfp pilus assembly protein PilN